MNNQLITLRKGIPPEIKLLSNILPPLTSINNINTINKIRNNLNASYWNIFDTILELKINNGQKQRLQNAKKNIIRICINITAIIKANQNVTQNLINDFNSKIQQLDILMFNQIFLLSQKTVDQTNDLYKEHTNISEETNKLFDKLAHINQQTINLEELLLKKSNDTTEYLNRQGLCASFQKRATWLTFQSWIWLIVSFIVLLMIISGVICELKKFPNIESILNLNINIDILLKSYLLYLPIASLSIWSLWFVTKKHLYYSRLADEYNYKNDISMAYYGYKNEILNAVRNDNSDKEADNIKLRLLDKVLSIITDNPIQEHKKTDTSPYTELAEKIVSELKK